MAPKPRPTTASIASPQPAFGAPLRKMRSYNSRTPMSAAAARSPIFAAAPNRGTGKGGGPSMFVMDPRTFATRLLVAGPSRGRGIARGVLEDTNSSLVRCFVWLKSASERWFTHLFLLLALIIYAIIGGAIFNRIEGDFEDEQNVSCLFTKKNVKQTCKNPNQFLTNCRRSSANSTTPSRISPSRR